MSAACPIDLLYANIVFKLRKKHNDKRLLFYPNTNNAVPSSPMQRLISFSK